MLVGVPERPVIQFFPYQEDIVPILVGKAHLVTDGLVHEVPGLAHRGDGSPPYEDLGQQIGLIGGVYPALLAINAIIIGVPVPVQSGEVDVSGKLLELAIIHRRLDHAGGDDVIVPSDEDVLHPPIPVGGDYEIAHYGLGIVSGATVGIGGTPEPFVRQYVLEGHHGAANVLMHRAHLVPLPLPDGQFLEWCGQLLAGDYQVVVIASRKHARDDGAGKVEHGLRIVHQLPDPVQVPDEIIGGRIIGQGYRVGLGECQHPGALIPAQGAQVQSHNLHSFQHITAGDVPWPALILMLERAFAVQGHLHRVEGVLLHLPDRPRVSASDRDIDQPMAGGYRQQQRADRERGNASSEVQPQSGDAIEAFRVSHVDERLPESIFVGDRTDVLRPGAGDLKTGNKDESRQNDNQYHTGATGGVHRRTQWYGVARLSYIIRFTGLSVE